MPKIKVTDELIQIIKTERKLRKIRGDELSSVLKKNTSFISMLENGRIGEIDLQVFFSIFETIIPDEIQRSEYVNNLLQKYSMKLSPEEIEKQQWMTIFDLQYRLIIIPEGVINYLKEKIDSLIFKGLTINNIIKKINENNEIEDKDTYEDNKVYVHVNENGSTSFSIKLNIEDDYLDKIFDKSKTKSNYVTILGIIYNLLKIEGYSKEEAAKMSHDILYKNKFYRLTEKNALLREDNFEELSKEDKDFKELTSELMSFLSFLGDEDVDYINERLRVLIDNLKSNISLTLAIIGIPIESLKELPFEKKKQFKEDFIKLIRSYELEKDSRTIERI